MKVKDLIRVLEEIDGEIEVVGIDHEYGFYYPVSICEVRKFTKDDDWISHDNIPQPTKVAFLG
jgi:hypothetical protein